MSGTVISDEDGKEYPVQQVHAVAVSANASQAAPNGERISKQQAAFIQEAMSQAVVYCYQEGNTDPGYVKKAMQVAREAAKRAISEGGEGNLAG